MDSHSGYEPSCASRCADGVIRGGLTGLAWGAFFYPNGSDLVSVLNATPSKAATLETLDGQTSEGNNLKSNSKLLNHPPKLDSKSKQNKLLQNKVTSNRPLTQPSRALAASAKEAGVASLQNPIQSRFSIVEMINASREATVPRMRCMARSSWAFGGFCGVFSATVCVTERIRGKAHWGNEFIGGCVAGACVVPKHSPQTMVVSALAVGTLTAAGRFFKDD